MNFFWCTLLLLMLPLAVVPQDIGRLTMGKGSTKTYAVVIGISDYQNEAIPNLRFAHRDALAFDAYLKSESGGSLSDDQVTLLINEQATTAGIAAAMDWLLEVVAEGDQAIIYFSGHGDVETKTNTQHGFLLSYDSPATTYIAGAYPLFYLQSVIATLSSAKQAKVFMVMDACHSGKLAGSSVGGSTATSSALAKQFANEIKIMSCQPDQFSLEGEQWGGGRGVFSYHLIEGLTGLADQNEDYKVNLLELERYLEDQVQIAVAPDSQLPMSVGNKTSIVAFVAEEALLALKASKKEELPMLAFASSRGIEDQVLASLDTFTRQQYLAFKARLTTGPLLPEDRGIAIEPEMTAYEYYLNLRDKPALKLLYGSMKRSLVVALQDEAQQVINNYLEVREEQATSYGFDNRKEIRKNQKYARYLAVSAELLGEQHYMYADLRAKEYFFLARVEYHRAMENVNQRNALLHSALQKLNMGLSFQQNAPHILSEIGSIYSDLGDYEQSIAHYERALELSPTWPIPYFMLAADFFNKDEFSLAIKYAEKTLELQPGYQNAFSIMLSTYYTQDKYDLMVDLCRNALEKDSSYLAAYLPLGLAYDALGKPDSCEAILMKAMDLAPENALVYNYLGQFYFNQERYDKAIEFVNKAITIDSLDASSYSLLAFIHLERKEWAAASAAFTKSQDFYPDDFVALGQLGLISLAQGQYEKAWERFNQAAALAPDDPLNAYNYCCYYYEQGQRELAFQWLEKAFQLGLYSYLNNLEVQLAVCFKSLTRTKQFKQLKAQYKME